MTPTILARSLFCALPAAMIASCAHATTTTVSTATALFKAMTTAQDGDTILLASGNYGGPLWAPGGVVHKVPVTIKPAPGASPVFTAIGFGGPNVGGYVVDGLDIRMTPATRYGVTIERAQDITLQNLKIHQGDDKTLAGTGIFIRNSKRITIQNNELRWIGDGIDGIADTQGAYDSIQVLDNNIHDFQSNGMLNTGITNAVFRRNTITNCHNAGGSHPDGIQFSNSYDGPTSENVEISDNEITRGDGDLFQGIFIEDGKNWTVTGNSVRGAMQNGIAFARSANIIAEQNFVQPYADQGSILIVRQQADTVTVANNTARVVIGTAADGAAQPTHVTRATGNTAPPAAASPTDLRAYSAWKAALRARSQGSPAAAAKPRSTS